MSDFDSLYPSLDPFQAPIIRSFEVLLRCFGQRASQVCESYQPVSGASIAVQYCPLYRSYEIEEIAAAVFRPCRDAASFVTGHAVSPDGGCAVR